MQNNDLSSILATMKLLAIIALLGAGIALCASEPVEQVSSSCEGPTLYLSTLDHFAIIGSVDA